MIQSELDNILLDQFHSAKRRKKMLKRMIKLMPFEKQLSAGEIANEKYIEFIVSMIENKEILQKKYKKKKEKNTDILAKNPIYEWYKLAYVATTISYKMLMESTTSYISYFKRDKNEKS